MRHRKLHLITGDHRREINIRDLAKHGAFVRPMRFPFQHLEVTGRDHIRVFRVGDKSRQSPQIIAVRRKAKRGTFDRTAYQRDYMRKWRGGIVGKKASRR